METARDGAQFSQAIEQSFDVQFDALQAAAGQYPERSSEDTRAFLAECDKLLETAEAGEDPEKVRQVLFFALKNAWHDGEYTYVTNKATDLIKNSGSTENRIKGLCYRFMANKRLGQAARGQKRLNFFTQAKNDCGDMILAMRSAHEEADFGTFNDISFYEQDYRELEALISKKSVWQRIGQLVMH